MAEAGDGKLIAIDGKTLRRSFAAAGNRAAIHMVSAWSATNHLVLGQLTTDAKSNEITAIPQLLKLLDIADSVVTIDAMGCQKAIAQQIVEQRGHYVLQVKDNQPKLHDLLKETFDEITTRPIPAEKYGFYEHTDGGHGRVETRRIWTTEWLDWYDGRSAWARLGCLLCVESTRTVGGKTSVERRYFISDLAGQTAETLLVYVRGHWGIENQLHWSLDVSFREDERRNRVGHSAENFSRMRRLALNLLRQEKNLQTRRQDQTLQSRPGTRIHAQTALRKNLDAIALEGLPLAVKPRPLA